jgi:hypothetical protein
MAKKEKTKKQFPMTVNAERNNPEVPMEGSITFLKACQKLLTPDEIQAAVDKGQKDHQDRMQILENSKKLANVENANHPDSEKKEKE